MREIKSLPKMDKIILWFTAFICLFQGIENLIVPDEIPSLLSIVYSQIPPIKKGTDSRLGWGFRLGDHADIQVLLELGPQTNTRPLSNEGDKNNKRNVNNNLRNTLWAQNQLLKQRKQAQQISDTAGGKWIQSWSNSMAPIVQPTGLQSSEVSQEHGEGIGEIPAALVIPEELEELYGKSKPTHIKIQEPLRPVSDKPVSALFPEVLAQLYGKQFKQEQEEQQPTKIDEDSEESVRFILQEFLKDKTTTSNSLKAPSTTDKNDALDNVDLE